MSGVAVRKIIDWIETLKGSPINPEEGIHHGDGTTTVESVTVCWKATPEAIAAAGSRGDRLIIGHESLYDPYYSDFDPTRTPGWREWAINVRRRELLERHDLTFLRLHTTVDWLCIVSEMAVWLELIDRPADPTGWNSVWEVEPTTLRELISRVKRISDLPAIRVAAPHGLDVPVARVALLVGGAGLVPNGGAFEPGIRAQADAYIAGETDNYGFRYALESGIPLIETSHERCENPGLRRFTEMLSDRFPELRVTFYENDCPYVVM